MGAYQAKLSLIHLSKKWGPLHLVGDAAITPDARLRLTPAATSQEGAAWYTAEKQDVVEGFTTTFQFQMADNAGGPDGSDGFTFAIQNTNPSYLGAGGGNLGYNGLADSLVIEFDTFQNSENNDSSQSRSSVHTGGTGPNSPLESFSLGRFTTNPIMDNAAVHTAKITYTPGTLSVYLDNMTTPVLSVAVNLSNTLALDQRDCAPGLSSLSLRPRAAGTLAVTPTDRSVNWAGGPRPGHAALPVATRRSLRLRSDDGRRGNESCPPGRSLQSAPGPE